MDIKDRVVVITGGASGIGAAAAEGLARMGAMIVLGDMNEQRLEEVGGRIRDQGFPVRWKSLNVTVEQEVQAFMDFAVHEFGAIHLVVASAGIARDSFFVTPDKDTGKVKKFMTTDQWQQVMEVNLTGVFLTLREAVIRMVDNQWEGVLIPISSINKAGELGQLNYASTKAAIALWPKILAGEFHARGIRNIRIAAIAPGYVETPILTAIKPEILANIIRQVPIGRLVQTNEILHTIRYIMENEAIHGTTIEVSGGIIANGISK
jgi:3-oxoacyl-[acyl-carrier protein] reductase